MELHFEELITQITDFMKSEAKTETVVGNPFELGEFKCVPVIKVGMGFGSGGGEGTDPKSGKGHGEGAGAGMGIQPIGFLITRGEEISFLSAEKTSGLSKAFEKVPELFEKYAEIRLKEKEMA